MLHLGMKNKSILFALLAVSVLYSCKKNDKEKPTYSFSLPGDSVRFTAGESIPFVASFFDNEDLSQYKIDIHDNFDGHDHDKYIAQIWNRILIENISGTQAEANLSIPIPDSAAAGWYHFLLTAVDRSGNQSEIAFRNIYIQNGADTLAPLVNVTSPAEGGSTTLGNSVFVSAEITDNADIYLIQTRVRRPNSASNLFLSTDTLSLGQSSYIHNKEIPTGGSAWTTGNYELTLIVNDSYYNRTVKVVNFQLN